MIVLHHLPPLLLVLLGVDIVEGIEDLTRAPCLGNTAIVCKVGYDASKGTPQAILSQYELTAESASFVRQLWQTSPLVSRNVLTVVEEPL